jgi:anthraniloyl-CoA monooxygenase
MLTPLKVRDLTLKNRIVVSPMATYSAVDGVPQDFHLVHLGARALGGAALVFVEMTSPTPEGRITPGCPGCGTTRSKPRSAHRTDFVHGQSTALIGLQLGHSGPKGFDPAGLGRHRRAAARGNWPLLAASAMPMARRTRCRAP